MHDFEIVADASVTLLFRGLFKPCRVWRRGDRLFAGVNGGFFLLKKDNYTSRDGWRWESLSCPGAILSRHGPVLP